MVRQTQANTDTNPILELVKRVEHLLDRQAFNPRQRILIALAGVPGSGKSTVSQRLLDGLTSQGIRDIMVLPMVGHARVLMSAIS